MDTSKIPSKQVFCGKESSGNRSVTLQNLLSAGILESGQGAMTIEYLVRLLVVNSFVLSGRLLFPL